MAVIGHHIIVVRYLGTLGVETETLWVEWGRLDWICILLLVVETSTDSSL